MRIIVFGAGGFVGGSICEELCQRTDVEQVACVRKWASAVRLARRGVDLRQVDLENADQLPAVLAGADVVINASMPGPSREPDLTHALYLASVKAGVRRFVQFSSAAVYGNRTGQVTETISPSPIDDYSRGKAEMERRLIEATAGSSTQVFILRPSIIYGPFSNAWTVRYVERIAKGRWLKLGRIGNGACNLVHVQDIARVALAAATNDVEPGTHILNVNGSDAVTWNDYITRLGDALGLRNRVTPNALFFRGMAIGAELLRIAAGFTWVRSLYHRSAGSTKSAMTGAKNVTDLYPSWGELNLLGRKVYYSPDRAAQLLGAGPSISLEEGIRQSIAWCRVHGVVS
jgi:nucleoside-diphosphate-sugar epimerase